jgi:hypothetical protein
MAKKYIESDIFEREFFYNMNSSEKLFYLFCITRCDSIGILTLNRPLIETLLGIKIDLQSFLKKTDGNIIQLDKKRLFIPKWVKFQYGGFNQSKQHETMAKKMTELSESFDFIRDEINSLYSDSIEYFKTLNRPSKDPLKRVKYKYKDKSKYKDKDKFIVPSLKEIIDYIKQKNYKVDANQFYEYFTNSNWVDSKGNDVKNWKNKLMTWNKFTKDEPKPEVYEINSGKTDY